MHILDFLFDCQHKHLSFPITMKPLQRHSNAERRTGTYVVCLDCGKEFPYDWKNMHMLPLLDGNETASSSSGSKRVLN